MTRRHQTALGEIDNMSVSIECHCGHHGMLPVTALLDRWSRKTALAEVLAHSACQNCGRRQAIKHVRLVFILPKDQPLAREYDRYRTDDLT